MFRRLITVIAIDIVTVFVWDYWANSIHADQEQSIGVLAIIPAFTLLSGVVGVIFLLIRKRAWANALFANMIFALLIFLAVFRYEFWKQQHDRYRTFYFTDAGKTYSIILNLNKGRLQNGLTYAVYERVSEYGNSGTNLDGKYTERNDTIIMTSDSGKIMKIFNMTLLDYAHPGDSKELRDNPN
jgi:hypothetical protein